MSYGILLIRLVVGLTIRGHGAQKLFGWFGGYGLKGTGGWMESIGLKPGVLTAFLVVLGELAAGLLFISGIMMPLASTLLIAIMLVAIVSDSGKNAYWITQNGFEFDTPLPEGRRFLRGTAYVSFTRKGLTKSPLSGRLKLSGYLDLSFA